MARKPQAAAASTPGVFTQAEFDSAVEAATAKATAAATEKILATLAAARGSDGATATAGTAAPAADMAFADGLALAIAKLGSQGVGRDRIVAPEVIAARQTARQKMVDLIVAARVAVERGEGEPPAYQLRNKIFIGEHITEPIWTAPGNIQKRTELDWDGVPNEHMIPINAVATAIHAEFMASIGSAPSVTHSDIKDIIATSGGIVITGGSQSMRAHNKPPPTVGEGTAGETVKLRGRQTPGAIVEHRVLGTVADPARQNA